MEKRKQGRGDKVRASLSTLIALALAASLAFAGCTGQAEGSRTSQEEQAAPAGESQTEQSGAAADDKMQSEPAAAFDLSQVGEWTGEASVQVNGDAPYFTADELAYASSNPGYESYPALDSLGRCGAAIACLGTETMPAEGEERGSIGMVKPSGWHTVKYDSVEGKYLYNRCHLIGWQLSDENANEKNLVTGTRYMNVDGMLKWEDDVAQYIRATGNHVLYRSTPVFQGDELVCRGVLIEAQSIEDDGAGVKFAVWCYNAQPGIHIDYATGDSSQMQALPAASGSSASDTAAASQDSAPSQAESSNAAQTQAYVLNTSTKKFHKPGCSSVSKMSAKNRSDVEDTRDDLIARGYSPCGNCNP